MRKKKAYSLCSALLLVTGFFTITAAGQTPSGAKPGLENEPTVKPSPRPTPTPEAILMADPWLADPRREIPPPNPAYYIHMRNISRAIISDERGNTDDLFRDRFIQTVRWATYAYSGDDSIDIVVPVNHTYSITFQTKDLFARVGIVKGRGDKSADQAIRYCDLDSGRRSLRLEITPQGIMPLRLDTNNDGRFDSVIEPTASVRGLLAQDTGEPEVRFHVLERSPTSLLISIEASDGESAVKSVMYSVDGHELLPYKSPFRIKLSQTPFLFAWADDSAGNRSVNVFRLDSRNN